MNLSEISQPKDVFLFQPHTSASLQVGEGTVVGFYQMNMMGERGQGVGICKGLIIMIDHKLKKGGCDGARVTEKEVGSVDEKQGKFIHRGHSA